MQGSVKEIKNRIQEEFSRFHNLLDRRQEKLTTKLDKYLSSQNQEKLNLVKFENATEIDSIDTLSRQHLYGRGILSRKIAAFCQRYY